MNFHINYITAPQMSSSSGQNLVLCQFLPELPNRFIKAPSLRHGCRRLNSALQQWPNVIQFPESLKYILSIKWGKLRVPRVLTNSFKKSNKQKYCLDDERSFVVCYFCSLICKLNWGEILTTLSRNFSTLCRIKRANCMTSRLNAKVLPTMK